MDDGTDPVRLDRPRPPQPMDGSSYMRIDLYVLLDGDRGRAKVTAVVYGDRGQLVVERLVLPGVALSQALATSIDVLREHWPSLTDHTLPFPPVA